MKNEKSSKFIKDELQKLLKSKSSALEKLKREIKINSAAYEREAQIAAALERVRSSSMNMQKSDAMKDVINVVTEQLQQLGFDFETANFITDYSESGGIWWISTPGVSTPTRVYCPSTNILFFNNLANVIKKKIGFFTESYSSKEKDELFDYLFENTNLKEIPVERKNYIYAAHGIASSSALSKNVLFSVANYQAIPYSDEENTIIKRIGDVFEQCYTRFLDLQKAETQARESQIEAALERVRSRFMGMQKSDELREVGNEIFQQLVQLNFNIEGDGFCVEFRESNDFYFWAFERWGTGPELLHYPCFDHPYFNRFIEARDKSLDFFTNSFTFEEKNSFWDYAFQHMPEIDNFAEIKKSIYASPGMVQAYVLLKNVAFYVWNMSGILYTAAENVILMRFGKVFEQAYIRFNDLKKAEVQALEAIRRASVDRVRAEIASMRTTSDLERITPLIWNELTTLDVPFLRCGVFIMDEGKQEVRAMLSTPDGKAIATLHVPFEFNLPIITNGVDYWRKKKMYKEHWDALAFTKSWMKLSSLGKTSMVSPPDEHPAENLYLHLLPFLQGMLFVGNDAPLNDDQLPLVQNLGDTFSTAYARYEDFNKLESANVKIKRTLADLKQAQAQLVQSEKMASLGEITAGIAHEIQNPLNFVNNFSEINRELIEELKEEVKAGNNKEVIAIADDISANEEKIVHHGQRADAIVKSMLQHSGSSKSVKELTNINVLADEYLRLSYHTLRAKDTEFNAIIQTDFDKEIGKINIRPQEFGRVLLNLYNNSFYSVAEKKKRYPSGYEPTVSVSTKRVNDKVEIIVKDNGNGIPQNVVDKIFQPFFTTKPTGQGTGLGLSLSYDIIKAHGGVINVETKEGEGSQFIIRLHLTS